MYSHCEYVSLRDPLLTYMPCIHNGVHVITLDTYLLDNMYSITYVYRTLHYSIHECILNYDQYVIAFMSDAIY